MKRSASFNASGNTIFGWNFGNSGLGRLNDWGNGEPVPCGADAPGKAMMPSTRIKGKIALGIIDAPRLLGFAPKFISVRCFSSSIITPFAPDFTNVWREWAASKSE